MKIDMIVPGRGSEKNMSTTRLRTRQTKPTASYFPLLVYLNQYRYGLSMMLTTTIVFTQLYIRGLIVTHPPFSFLLLSLNSFSRS